MSNREVYISVDIETSGSVPGIYSMLSLGACLVDDDTKAFSCRIRPISDAFEPEAMAKTGIDLEELKINGQEPEEALIALATWMQSVLGDGGLPVFVGMPAVFDWGFVNWYFIRFLGINPFGFAALDIKSLYMGAFGKPWFETRSSMMDEVLHPTLVPNHDPLQDARYQAELFRLIMAEVAKRV